MTLVTLVTPVCDPEVEHLVAMLASVRAQTVADVEHVLVDDASTRPEVIELLSAVAARGDAHVVTRVDRGGISAATNAGIAVASGEFVGFLDHDDVLEPDAVDVMLDALLGPPGADVAYSDHDFIDPEGRLVGPCLTPDWSPERRRSQNSLTKTS